MLTFYLDTSAWVKRYVEETGSDRVSELFLPSPECRLYSCELAWAELHSALSWRAREGSLTRDDLQRALADIERDRRNCIALLTVPFRIVRRAAEPALIQPLRALDAIHLATALDLEASRIPDEDEGFGFVSSDASQIHAAKACGLQVEIAA